MNRSILLLIVLAGAFIFIMRKDRLEELDIGTDERVTQETDSPIAFTPMQVFHDPTGGYRLQYPADWKLEDKTQVDGLIRADIVNGAAAGAQIRIEKNVSTDFTTFVNHYVERFKSDMTEHWGGDISEIERRFEAIGVHEGCRVSLILKRGDGQEWFFKEYLWPHDDWVTIIQAGTLLGSRIDHEPVLDAMAESFESKR